MCVSEHVPKVDFCQCLAIRGSKLLCRGELAQDNDASDKDNCDDVKKGFLLVLDYEVMSSEHMLLLDYDPNYLLSCQGKVWSIMIGCPVVVWGKAERGEGGQGA